MARLDEIRELTRVRVLSFLREPEAVFWVFMFPMVMAAVLGFAFRSGKPEPSTIGVVASEALAATLGASEAIDVETFETFEDAHAKLRRGAIDGVVEEDELGALPKLTFDPVRAEAVTARLRLERALTDDPDEPIVATEELTEKGSRYVDFLFPGLLGMNLMGTGIWGIGFAIADVRRRKFLKRLLVTPMRRTSFFLSFMLSRLVFLILEVALLVMFAAWVLGVPFRSDALSFGVVCLLGALVFAGFGILVASRARTIEGASGLMNLVMMPMWLASGVFFSYERFPDALHPILQLLPLTALNDALRNVMLDGDSVLSLGKELTVMTAWCVASFVVALKIFRWE
ncbi:MAG: ABC transporter permease [Phycisphaera sp.]|nr:MAG: ABC transporter permease [Phycisphaera sp.]